MNSKLDELLGFHQQALSLRSYRQQLLASNIANADTPNYKARDIDFAKSMESALAAQSARAAGTAPAGAAVAPELLYRIPIQPGLDGNTVDMNQERSQFADNALHFQAGLTFINAEIKMMLAAVQG